MSITFANPGPSCQTYQVLASEDLTLPIGSWEVLTSGTFTTPTVTYTDADAPNHALRFYRSTSP